MEEKIFDLLEKVYIELQGAKSHIEKVEQEQAVTSGHLSKLEVKIEHDISRKVDALYEFRDDAISRFDRIEKKVDEISDKVDYICREKDLSLQNQLKRLILC